MQKGGFPRTACPTDRLDRSWLSHRSHPLPEKFLTDDFFSKQGNAPVTVRVASESALHHPNDTPDPSLPPTVTFTTANHNPPLKRSVPVEPRSEIEVPVPSMPPSTQNQSSRNHSSQNHGGKSKKHNPSFKGQNNVLSNPIKPFIKGQHTYKESKVGNEVLKSSIDHAISLEKLTNARRRQVQAKKQALAGKADKLGIDTRDPLPQPPGA